MAALQLEYSLVERHIEREHLPASRDLGMGLVAWSPLAGGLLTGKYTRSANGVTGPGRLSVPRIATQPWLRQRTDQDWRIVDALTTTAGRLGRSPAQVALNWISRRPGVTSTLVGARTLDQLEGNLTALDVELPGDDVAHLDHLSRPSLYQPYLMFDPTVAGQMFTPGFEVHAPNRPAPTITPQ